MKTKAINVLFVSMLFAGSAQAGDAAAGKAKAMAVCASCHGLNGISVQPLYPNLAGQKKEYMMKTLTGFKSGERKDPIMNAMAAPLSDADIDNVATYYSSLGN